MFLTRKYLALIFFLTLFPLSSSADTIADLELRLAQLNAQLKVLQLERSIAPAACLDLKRNVRFGARDVAGRNDTRSLQALLRATGFLSAEPTGYFGVQTLAAVKKYQLSVGVDATGYVGPQTRAKIKSTTCDIAASNALASIPANTVPHLSPVVTATIPSVPLPVTTATVIAPTPQQTPQAQPNMQTAVVAETVNVRDFGAKGDGVTDDTAAIQAAHDSCSSGAVRCTIQFPEGKYLLAENANYVFISKRNVSIVGLPRAEIVTPGCENAEVRTGTPYNTGFNVTGDNAEISINICGASVSWTPRSDNDRISLVNMKFRNMYYNALAINNTPFSLANIDGVTFDTSRDMVADVGNYHAISRSAGGRDAAGGTIRVNRSLFRGVSGGIDAHNVKNLMIGGGTRFEGCDFLCIKLATLDNVQATQNLTVDSTVTFNGTCINGTSSNRHLACSTPRPQPGFTMYIGFIQVFNDVQWHGLVENGRNKGVVFLDGTFLNASLAFDGARFTNTPEAIEDAQGTISIRNSRFENSNIIWSAVGTPRKLTIANNQFINSFIGLTKRASAAGDRFDILDNEFSYASDNKGVIRFVNYGVDGAPYVWIDRNRITLSGGATVAMDIGLSGTKANLGSGNQYGSASILGLQAAAIPVAPVSPVADGASARNASRNASIATLAGMFNAVMNTQGSFPSSNGYVCMSTSCGGYWNQYVASASVDASLGQYQKPVDPSDTTREASGYIYFDPSAWAGNSQFVRGYYLDWMLEAVPNPETACGMGQVFETNSNHIVCFLKLGNAPISQQSATNLANILSAIQALLEKLKQQ